MKESEAVKLVAILQAAFPRDPIGEETIAVYRDMLGDLDGQAAMMAVRRLIMGGARFFPTIGEIRKLVAEAETMLPSADEAWEEVRRTIQSVGYYQEPKFSHDAIARAVDCIGWKTLCHSEAIGVERAHFNQAYCSIRERWVTEANVGKLEAPRHPKVLELVAAVADAKTLKDNT